MREVWGSATSCLKLCLHSVILCQAALTVQSSTGADQNCERSMTQNAETTAQLAVYIQIQPTMHTESGLETFMVQGGDNWAEKHGKLHRTTVCEQLLPETEKVQSVTPQTTNYIEDSHF